MTWYKPPTDLESIRAKILEAAHGNPSLIHLSNQLRVDPAKGMIVADFRQQPNPQAVQFLYKTTDQLVSQGYSFKYYNPEQNVYWIKARNAKDNWSTHKKAQSEYSQVYGEYWIGDQGEVMYADGDIGQKGHTAYVVDYILDSHNVSYEMFQNLLDCNYPLPNGSKDIYQELARFKLTPQEVSVAIDACNGQGNVARQYGLQNLGWKRVMGNHIETHTLTQMDLSTIVQGLNEIAQDDEVGFSTWNIECNSPQRYFPQVPLKIMEMGLKAVMSYRSKGSQPMNLPNGAQASGWYNKLAQVINGTEKGLHYQSFGHKEKNVQLWWLDYDWNIQTKEVLGANDTHEQVGIPEGVIFMGRYIPQDKIITVYNAMKDPMVPKWFKSVEKILYRKFGAGNKIYTFFE